MCYSVTSVDILQTRTNCCQFPFECKVTIFVCLSSLHFYATSVFFSLTLLYVGESVRYDI